VEDKSGNFSIHYTKLRSAEIPVRALQRGKTQALPGRLDTFHAERRTSASVSVFLEADH
jgi:hypothetical protein